eukprot:CAMPEP_0115005334 /NCGR_PEP_ID=MMETSP0216-20121206/19791_1 /TAXON_ID=223996 /ORGANISM="Protocruzia adherens, Strain Boccale" /LENGTH=262 /DNA_ID=CAMNT_0002371603 /DNA_START=98 /DNA_END=886 /DNA_ORIENTATION=+
MAESKPVYTKEDPFGPRAQIYSQFRNWDPAILTKLAEVVPSGDICIDVATGTGQLVPTLASTHKRVIACDYSEKQVEKAKETLSETYPNCSFEVRTAENFGDLAEPGTVDTITVGEAFHWFNQEKFWEQVARVLKPEGTVAILGYSTCIFDDAELDAAHDEFHKKLAPFWEFDQQYLQKEYEGTNWPFDSVEKVQHIKKYEGPVDHLFGFISTWSALAKARNNLPTDPYIDFEAKAQACQARTGTFKFKFPYFMYVLKKFRR